MKKNLFTLFLAVVMIAAVVFVAAPSAKAAEVYTADADNAVLDVAAGDTVNLNGCENVTINVTGEGAIYLVDTANLNDLTGAASGSATVNGAVADYIQHTDGFKYLAVKDGDTYSAHPFNLSVDKYGVNTHYSAVSVRVTVIADDTVAKLIDAGEFGMHNYTAGVYARYWKTFAGEDGEIATNGIRAYFYLDGSFAEDVLTNNLFATVGAYIKIGNTTIESNTKVDIYPEAVLATLNADYANYSAKADKVVEMANKAEHLKAYCCNFCGHISNEKIVEPTCEKGGSYTLTYTCKCGKAGESKTYTAHGHVYGADVTRPTCDAAGSLKLSACTKCGAAPTSTATLSQKKLTHTANFLTVDCRVSQTNKDFDGDGVVNATNHGYYVTNYGSDRITPFKFLNFGDGDTCEVTFYIFNGTQDTLRNISLSYNYGTYAYASLADANDGVEIPGTSASLNLAPGQGKTVTLTVPRSCYFSNRNGVLTNEDNLDSNGMMVSYRDMGLRINLTPATEKASPKIFVSCLSDSVVTESLSQTYRVGTTTGTMFFRNNATYLASGTGNYPCTSAVADNTFKNAFASYYESGYTCIHDAVPKA